MVSRKSALIIGITGQDGSYLTELLLQKGYVVHGLIRRSSSFNTGRIDHLYQDDSIRDQGLFLHYGDLLDGSALQNLLLSTQPSEIYNLGAQSHVKVSFEIPEYTTDTVYMGTLRLLEACRQLDYDMKIYQASSSEMFGSSPPPQTELTVLRPRSPYGIAKVAAYHLTRLYRHAYQMHICNGILFNHESPRRGETFVTRKVCKAAARIKCGLQKKLILGNLDAVRDWGYAKEYVEAMWLMLQHLTPDDYVIATGEMHSVRELVQEAFTYVGLNWRDYVVESGLYKRPAEVDALRGNASKAARVLGWEPQTKFRQLVHLMVEAELEVLHSHG